MDSERESCSLGTPDNYIGVTEVTIESLAMYVRDKCINFFSKYGG